MRELFSWPVFIMQRSSVVQSTGLNNICFIIVIESLMT